MIFHIVDRDAWAVAVQRGVYRPASLEQEGFVHFSYADQVRGTVDLFYAQVPNLFVVEIDPARLRSEVKVEGGFPHVYGPIPTTAAMRTHELTEFTRAGPAPTDR
jgi:uncharacterized protein (DUF952 family)